MEDIINNQDNEEKVIKSNLRLPRTGSFSKFLNTLEWYWYIKIKKFLKYFYALMLTIFSVLVIIDETSIFF